MTRHSWTTWLLLGVLVLAWQLPGLIGRDPWKADEPYTTGIVLNIVETGDWVVPTVGADPFMEKPPAYFLTAALTARIFAPFLEFHEAARLATLFFNVLTLVAVGGTSRVLNGKGRGWTASLLYIGCIGSLHVAHFLVTDMALLAGFSVALAGLALGLTRPFAGGLVCGTGTGLAFLAKGLVGPGLLGLSVLALPMLVREWRSRRFWLLLGGIVPAVLPWIVVWPLALWLRSPDLFLDWFWDNNFGRFLGTNASGPEAEPFYFVALLPWYSLPAFPLVLWTLWRGGRDGLRNPAVRTPLVMFCVSFAVLSLSRDAREIYALPLLPPVFVLGARRLHEMGPRVSKTLAAAFSVVFSMLACVIWGAWAAIVVGRPEAVATRVAEELPGFVLFVGPGAFGVALAATVAWGVFLFRMSADPPGVVVRWAAGWSLLYLLGMTLLLPMTNWNMSYRRQFVPLRDVVPPDAGPVVSRGLTSTQRGMVHYFGGVRLLSEEIRGSVPEADWFLVQGNLDGNPRPDAPGPDWTKVWETVHDDEHFVLFRRGG